MDDLRAALQEEAEETANFDVESLLTGARRRVAATRRRRLGALSAATAAALVVLGGVVAGTLSTNQALPQPAGPGPTSVKAPVVDHAPPSASAPASQCDKPSRKSNSVVLPYWVDFVQLGGTQFIADPGPGHPIASAQMGAVVGRVRCQLSALKLSEPPGPIVDGDAGYLPIGTEVRSILGFAPSCRVAARFNGTNRVYLAHHDVEGRSEAVPCAKAP